MHIPLSVINPRGACAARVAVVGLCIDIIDPGHGSKKSMVCVSVCDRTTSYEAGCEQYQRLQCYMGMQIISV